MASKAASSTVFYIVTGEPFKQSAELTGEPIKMKGTMEHCAGPGVLYSDRRAVQAIGTIDRGADQNKGNTAHNPPVAICP